MSSSSPATSNLHPILRSLRHRNFALFFSGQLISLVGTWMQSVAQAWLIYRLTGSSLLLGAVSFAGQIPIFLVAPLGGAVADVNNRRKVVIATQTASMILAFILASLTLTHAIREWHIIVLAALLGIVNAFDIPARQALLSQMVTREDLTNAIALNSSMFNGARIIGPAIAGVTVAAIGEGWCFFANAISYTAVLVSLIMMRLPAWSRPPLTGSTFGRIKEGFQYVYSAMPVRSLLLLVGFLSLFGMPFSVLMPVFADHILHGGAQTLGMLMGASGVGALAGALTMAGRTTLRGLGRWIVYSTILFGLALCAFAYSTNVYLSLALLVPAGGAIMIQNASSNTLIQSMVPDGLRGRVMSVYSMMFMGMAPIGALLAGALAHRLGAPLIVALGGAASVLAGTVFANRLPVLRVEARRLIAEFGGEAQELPQRS